MDVPIQIMMGISLAACAGLRAWMPLLLVGLLGRSGFLSLNPGFDVLTHTGTLAVLGIATAIEILGDKIIVIDHLLDSLGTILRPMAGTLLAASLFTGIDPQIALLLGLLTGGAAASAVHVGKSGLRLGTTALAPAHGGLGNVALSLFEDVLAFGGIWVAVLVPVVAFFLVTLSIYLAYRVSVRIRRRRSLDAASSMRVE